MTVSKQSQDGTSILTPDDEQRGYPKLVDFYDRINFDN
jgi:hypothetical protein